MPELAETFQTKMAILIELDIIAYSFCTGNIRQQWLAGMQL